MATLTVQQAALAGAAITEAAASAGGDDFPNDGRTVLVVKNADATPTTVTVAAAVACELGTLHNAVVAVTNAQTWQIGPFPPGQFGASCVVTYSKVTSLTVAARRIV
jgi:hypothetical protein